MTKKDAAQEAVYEAIVSLCDNAQKTSGSMQGKMVRDAAIAYRAVAGGAQPGGVPMAE